MSCTGQNALSQAESGQMQPPHLTVLPLLKNILPALKTGVISVEVPNMPVKYGVIGCGAIGQRRHIPECIANPDSKLVALADPVAERVAELGKKYGAKHYTDYKEML